MLNTLCKDWPCLNQRLSQTYLESQHFSALIKAQRAIQLHYSFTHAHTLLPQQQQQQPVTIRSNVGLSASFIYVSFFFFFLKEILDHSFIMILSSTKKIFQCIQQLQTLRNPKSKVGKIKQNFCHLFTQIFSQPRYKKNNLIILVYTTQIIRLEISCRILQANFLWIGICL